MPRNISVPGAQASVSGTGPGAVAPKPGQVYRDTARNPRGEYATFTLREPGVSGPAINFEGMVGWHGTRSDAGEWFVTDWALGEYYRLEAA